MREVRVGPELAARISRLYGPERGGSGKPSEWDFWSGPLRAAVIGFRDFDQLRVDVVPAVRILHVVDPVFGALVFAGVLVSADVVEIADFEIDPDYWVAVEEDIDE